MTYYSGSEQLLMSPVGDAFDTNWNAGITFEDETTAGATITGADNGIYARN